MTIDLKHGTAPPMSVADVQAELDPEGPGPAPDFCEEAIDYLDSIAPEDDGDG